MKLNNILKTILLMTIAVLGLTSTATAMAKGTLADAVKLYEQGHYKEAFPILKKYAEQGNAKAQYKLGEMYYKGEGVAHDVRQSLKWYQKAAEGGDAGAQSVLGLFYWLGNEVEENQEEAKKWFQKACNNGDEGACSMLKAL